MTTQPVGGLRLRLIRDNLFGYVNSGLTALGWFNPGRAHSPISLLDYPLSRDDPIPVNTIAMDDDDIGEKYEEIGSALSEFRWTMYFDVYAESAPVGLHIRGDLEALLMGRITAVNYDYPGVPVYDLTQATPPFLFSVLIENPVQDHGRDWTGAKPWLKYWYVLKVDVVDWYATDDSAIYAPQEPT